MENCDVKLKFRLEIWTYSRKNSIFLSFHRQGAPITEPGTVCFLCFMERFGTTK
jgi:hypothetical protein